MNKRILLCMTLFTIYACDVNEKPEFIKVENIQVIESTSQYITLSADAFFINHNDIGGTLKTDDIKVLINDNEMANVVAESFKVPAKDEFTIPLKAHVLKDSLFSNKSIGGLIGSLFSKSIKVRYKGETKYKVLGFSHGYKIDKTESIKIKL